MFVVLLASCSKPTQTESLAGYPVSKKVDTVDTYFGESVPDPYRWMENDTTQDVADWVADENKVTFGFLEKIPYRAQNLRAGRFPFVITSVRYYCWPATPPRRRWSTERI